MDPKQKERDALYSLFGDLPPRDRKVSCKIRDIEECSDYILEKLVLDLNGIEDVPAVFVKPKEASEKCPVVLFFHSHGNNYRLGKNELIHGNDEYLYKIPYAKELTSLGYASLCIDMWGFGGRSRMTESEIFKLMLWNGQVMWGMMVFDALKSIDYLFTRDDIDTDHIITLGMSMGSTMSWWTAALDERVRACIDICCLTDFHTLIEERGLNEHGIYYYVPGLLKNFTSSKINALIAPRKHLSLAGNQDKLTPSKGLDIIDREMKKAYESTPDAWKLLRYNCGHVELAEMRREIVGFLMEETGN